MGVRGIFSMLRKHLPSYSTRKEYDADTDNVETDPEGNEDIISPTGEAPESPPHAAASTDKRDLIVVDGNGFVYWFVTFILGRESSCQTDYALLSRKLDEWLRQCYRLHLVFIFIFDGPTQPSKSPTKVKRMRNQSQVGMYSYIFLR